MSIRQGRGLVANTVTLIVSAMKKNEISRREFLRLSAAGAGALLLPDALTAALPQDRPDDPSIPLREMGRTGLRLPVLSMGVSQANTPNIIRIDQTFIGKFQFYCCKFPCYF